MMQRNKTGFFVFVGISLCGLWMGCATPDKHATVISVPFHAQISSNYCGVTALAMALDYFDIPFNTNSLIQNAFVPLFQGSSLQTLADTASNYGLRVTAHNSSTSDWEKSLEQGAIPLIYLLPSKNETIGHFSVVTGLSADRRFIRIHDITQPNRWIRLSRLSFRSINGVFPTLHLTDSKAPETNSQNR
jgi:ABC-type bacteriocin/lantibiotic exporter with double-glycine peptidase domain